MNLSQSDINSISRNEWIFGTTRFLPPMKAIPKQFIKELYGPNLYSRMVDAWYTGSSVPVAVVSFNTGFYDAAAIKRFIMAHLVSFEPEHEHKIAGCAYLLSEILTLKE